MIKRYFSAFKSRLANRKRDQQPEPTLEPKGLREATWEMMDRLAEHLDARMRLRGLNSAYVLSYFLEAVFGVKDVKADVMALPRERLEVLYNELQQVITYADRLGNREQSEIGYDDLHNNGEKVYYFLRLREVIDEHKIIDADWVDVLINRKEENE